MEYLRVAQDLEMYGIQYYPICVRFSLFHMGHPQALMI